MDDKDYLIIIGAPKCGTTSLASFVAQWPGAIQSEPKETLYFTGLSAQVPAGPGSDYADNHPQTEETFRDCFAADPGAQLRIEASTDNLWWHDSADRIWTFSQRTDVRQLKLLMLVRDPVARIVSEYEHTLRFGWQTGTLMASLEAEEARKAAGWHPLFYHITRSRYAQYLAPYRSRFNRDDILIMDFHRLKENGYQEKLKGFLGRDDLPKLPNVTQKNERYVPSNHRIHKILENERILKTARKLVPKGLRAKLRSAVTPENVPRYVPSSEEVAFIREALAEDIALCKADPDIPTEHWSHNYYE